MVQLAPFSMPQCRRDSRSAFSQENTRFVTKYRSSTTRSVRTPSASRHVLVWRIRQELASTGEVDLGVVLLGEDTEGLTHDFGALRALAGAGLRDAL